MHGHDCSNVRKVLACLEILKRCDHIAKWMFAVYTALTGKTHMHGL